MKEIGELLANLLCLDSKKDVSTFGMNVREVFK